MVVGADACLSDDNGTLAAMVSQYSPSTLFVVQQLSPTQMWLIAHALSFPWNISTPISMTGLCFVPEACF